MKRVSDDLRDAYRSLAEAEGDQPGHDYDRGYLTGWHDERRHIRRRHPDGGFREATRVAEFQAGYRAGREDGTGRSTDWWPDHALGVIDPDTKQAIPGSGVQPLADLIARAASRASYSRETAQPAAQTPVAVSGGLGL